MVLPNKYKSILNIKLIPSFKVWNWNPYISFWSYYDSKICNFNLLMFRIPDLPSGPTRRPGQPTPRTDVPSIGIPRDVFSSLPLLTTPRPRLSICWLQNEKTLIFNKKRWYSTKNADIQQKTLICHQELDVNVFFYFDMCILKFVFFLKILE